MNNVIEELRTRKKQKPFVPFVIVLKDGRRVQVTQMRLFAFNESRVGVFSDDDRLTVFKPSDIAEFEHLQPVG